MKQYNAIVIDDERNVREALVILINQNCPEIQVCGEAASAQEGRELLQRFDINFIFLDIAMPREDGFAFLQSIQKENYGVIFTTAYQEYAMKALKASAIDYLLKPINANELRQAVLKAIDYFELRHHKSGIKEIYHQSLENLHDTIHAADKTITKITVAEQFGFRIIDVAGLMYLEADSNYTILHLSGLDKIVATRTLGEFEKILDNPMFFRIHKSVIINLNFLKAYSSYEGNFAILTDGTSLNISRRKLNEFREAITHFAKSMG